MTVRPCSLKAASNRWGGEGGAVGPGWPGNKLQLNTIQYNTLHTIRKLLFARTARKHKVTGGTWVKKDARCANAPPMTLAYFLGGD